MNFPSTRSLLRVSAVVSSLLLVQCASKSTDEYEADFPNPQTSARPNLSTPRVERPVEAGGIQPGDRMEIFLDEDPSFNGMYVVRPEGHILVPKVGRIQVVGKSRAEAEQAIRTKFESTQVRSATLYVELISDQMPAPSPVADLGLFPNSLGHEAATLDSFHLTGRVNRPGQYNIAPKYAGRLGIYEAILMNGGVANFGDKSKVELLRYDERGELTRRHINLNKITSGNETNYVIGDGDIINVPEKVFGF